MEFAHIRKSKGDKLFGLINNTLLWIVLIVVLYPLIYIVSASFSNSHAVMAGEVWLLPVKPTLIGYEAVFKHPLIWSGFGNSIFYTSIGTVINVIITLLAAYPLSRRDLYGKNIFMFLFVFTFMFSGGLIPTYLLVKSLGMLNTTWAMLLPGALSVWNMIITRTYLQTTIPQEMMEATQMDGCSDYQFLWRMVIPLSGPIIAVNALFYAVSHWNSYFSAMIYLSKQEMYPLQLVLREILIRNTIDLGMMINVQEAAERDALRELLKYSLIVVATVPLLIVYPFVQKHFVKGIMIGSLKG